MLSNSFFGVVERKQSYVCVRVRVCVRACVRTCVFVVVMVVVLIKTRNKFCWYFHLGLVTYYVSLFSCFNLHLFIYLLIFLFIYLSIFNDKYLTHETKLNLMTL